MKKLFAGVAVSAALVGSVSAQTWDKDGDSEFRVARASVITSATEVQALELMSPKNDVYVSHKSTIAADLVVNGKLADGTVVTSQTLAATTAQSTTKLSAPQPFTHLTVAVRSPTTILSATNNVSTTVIETRSL